MNQFDIIQSHKTQKTPSLSVSSVTCTNQSL